MLAVTPGSWRWSRPNEFGCYSPEKYDEGIDRDHQTKKIEFFESLGCAYQIACELGSLNLAAEELYSDGSPGSGQHCYHYGSDDTNSDGQTTVSFSGGFLP